MSGRSVLKKVIGFSFQFIPQVQGAVDSGLTVFAFHDVTDEPSEFARQYGLVVSTATFKRQVRWIQANFELIHPAAILSSKALPRRAAVITFDDGYLGTFKYGLPILEQMGVPSLIFLNMQPIINGTAVLSAVACFLDQSAPSFSLFCERAGLQRPYHLSLNPAVFEAYQYEHGSANHSVVNKFQGDFADLQTLNKWDGCPLVAYGNHLFEHWNATALSSEELKEQYLLNERALSRFSARVNLFAFTNGQPDTCFSMRDIALLNSLGAGKVFSTAGGVNQNKQEFLLGRVALCESDHTAAGLWFRIGRAVFDKRKPTH